MTTDDLRSLGQGFVEIADALDTANAALADSAAKLAVAAQVATEDAAEIAQLKSDNAALQAYKDAHPDAPPPPPPPPPPTKTAALGYWDEFPLRTGSPTPSNYSANAGVSAALKAAGGRGSQIMHTYPGKWETNYASSTVAKSSEFGNAFLINMARPGPYADVTAGKYDAQIAAWFNSVPLSQACYVTMDSEPDNTSKATDAAAWCAAMAHIVNVAAPIYAARGLKGGVGGLLMSWTFSPSNGSRGDVVAVFKKWNWLAGVDKSALPYTIYMMDTYSKYLDATATTYESVPGISEIAFSQARSEGCMRFGIGEFGISREQRNASGKIVGTSATQQAWVRAEIPKILAIPGLAFAIMFAKPTGPESKNAELVDDAIGKPFTEYANAI